MKLYRYEFVKDNYRIGILAGLDDFFTIDEIFSVCGIFEMDLSCPNMSMSNTKSYFTEKGNRKFRKGIRKIQKLAESKGISGASLIFRHALRNALIPIITVLAPLIVDLMTGSLVVEKIFSIPGVGSLLVNAIQSNDYNVVISLSFIYSAMYIIIMLVVDILYGIIDPRIRFAKKGD